MTDILLHGKTAMITCASAGVGLQLAEALISSGCRVILADSSTHELESIIHGIGNARVIKIDVSDKESVSRAFCQLEKSGEKLDICINNAGCSITTPIFQEDKNNNFESIIKTNIIGVWYVTKEVAKHMKNHSIHGSIINITGICSQSNFTNFCAPYFGAKSAIVKMTKELVEELSAKNIRINCIIPKAHHHSLVENELNNSTYKNKMNSITPFGFVVDTLEELNGLLLLLSSNVHSSYITGACITVDGSINWGGEW